MTDIEFGKLIFTIICFFVVFGIPCGCFTAVVANAKGYNKFSWFVNGFCFLLIALIAIAGMPMKQDR